MKTTKFTPDYLLSIIPDQYNPNNDNKIIYISIEHIFYSIDTRLITSIEIQEVTVKLTIKSNKKYNIITLWKNCIHIHNTIFSV